MYEAVDPGIQLRDFPNSKNQATSASRITITCETQSRDNGHDLNLLNIEGRNNYKRLQKEKEKAEVTCNT
jgi:hypothetical protein